MAQSGVEAVAKVTALRPDVVLMDAVMPVMNGFEATRRIKQATDAPFVIIVTMHDGPEQVEAAEGASAPDPTAMSPADTPSFRRHAVDAVLAGPKTSRPTRRQTLRRFAAVLLTGRGRTHSMMEPRATLTASVRQYCTEVAKLPGVVRRELPAGQVLVPLSELGSVHSVVEGGALLVQATRVAGKLHLIDVLGPGSCVCSGENPAFAAGGKLSVVAFTQATVLELPAEQFFRHVSRKLSLATAAAAAKARQNERLLQRLALLAQRLPVQRAAGALVHLVDQVGVGCPITSGTRLGVTQALIAAIAGLTRQTINQALWRLAGGRLIHVERGMICVLDPIGLRAAASGTIEEPRGLPNTTCQLFHPMTPLNCVAPSRSGSRDAY